jgi:hypothetical protein
MNCNGNHQPKYTTVLLSLTLWKVSTNLRCTYCTGNQRKIVCKNGFVQPYSNWNETAMYCIKEICKLLVATTYSIAIHVVRTIEQFQNGQIFDSVSPIFINGKSNFVYSILIKVIFLSNLCRQSLTPPLPLSHVLLIIVETKSFTSGSDVINWRPSLS